MGHIGKWLIYRRLKCEEATIHFFTTIIHNFLRRLSNGKRENKEAFRNEPRRPA